MDKRKVEKLQEWWKRRGKIVVFALVAVCVGLTIFALVQAIRLKKLEGELEETKKAYSRNVEIFF